MPAPGSEVRWGGPVKSFSSALRVWVLVPAELALQIEEVLAGDHHSPEWPGGRWQRVRLSLCLKLKGEAKEPSAHQGSPLLATCLPSGLRQGCASSVSSVGWGSCPCCAGPPTVQCLMLSKRPQLLTRVVAEGCVPKRHIHP